MATIHLVRKDSAGWVGTIGDVHLQTYSVPAGAPLLKERHLIEQQFAESMKPNKIITGTIVYERAITQLDAEQRDSTTEHTKVMAPFLRASFLVLVAPGFKAAFIRGLIASLTLVAGGGYPFKVASSEDEAFSWVVPHLGGGMTKGDLRSGYELLGR